MNTLKYTRLSSLFLSRAIAMAIFSIFFVRAALAQTVIEKPVVGYTTIENVEITKIELTDTSTALFFEVSGRPGLRIVIPSKSHISPVGLNDMDYTKIAKGSKVIPTAEYKKLYLTRAEGVPLDKSHLLPSTGIINYVLFFPAIDKKTKRLDFGEQSSWGRWHFYDIELAPDNTKRLPSKIAGKWFETNAKKPTIAFYDSLVFFDCDIWECTEVERNKENFKIDIMNGFDKRSILLDLIASDTANITIPGKKPLVLHKAPK